ncbi:RHS repeat-associated protein [Flavobacterium arsenatis]|uniref:RHS repeat-associated protein n=1 Tax=Flavobacterium arsenatis TaxID=1484332 RepID=A0ABU1TSQ9_9FLAO|nr:RHS repeat-associated core domain-containing protein [Flavobacterium arsenatis]MDR6968891.1 RHS repeat-associated protein [Flavobacterium arsenatis]
MKHSNYAGEKYEYVRGPGGDGFVILEAVERNKYQYKYNGKEFQDELGLNMYAMDARQYDPAIGRWIVQDPVVHFDFSPYSAFDNNPVFWADPSGADAVYNWGTGKYMDGNNEVSFEQAMASHGLNADGSNQETPPDDITVNSKGEVTNVVKTDRADRYFDEDGTQLFFNDPKFDSQWSGYKKGDKLYTSISTQNILQMILDAGVNFRGGFSGYFGIAFKSHSSADFGFNVLRHKYNMYNTEYDGYEAGNGAFFRVDGQKSIYNFADFSQFLWGGWMRGNTMTLTEASMGAHMNNFLSTIFSIDRSGGISDSEADQRAIQNGYNYINNLISQWRKK